MREVSLLLDYSLERAVRFFFSKSRDWRSERVFSTKHGEGLLPVDDLYWDWHFDGCLWCGVDSSCRREIS